MLQVPQMDDLSNRAVSQIPAVAVSARCRWTFSLPIAGTVNALAAAAETLTPNAIYAAALADTAGTALASLKVLQVPPNCTYLELAAFGDNAAVGTAPVVELYRSAHPNVSVGVGSGIGLAIPAGEEEWARLFSVLGNANTTFSTSVNDLTGAAGAHRYGLDEGTYLNQVFDVRGARAVVVRLKTAGTTGNWSLAHRFF